jgi:hypothetical protein
MFFFRIMSLFSNLSMRDYVYVNSSCKSLIVSCSWFSLYSVIFFQFQLNKTRQVFPLFLLSFFSLVLFVQFAFFFCFHLFSLFCFLSNSLTASDCSQLFHYWSFIILIFFVHSFVARVLSWDKIIHFDQIF